MSTTQNDEIKDESQSESEMENSTNESLMDDDAPSKRLVDEHVITNGKVQRIIMGLTQIGNLEIEDFQLNYGIGRSLSKLESIYKAFQKSELTYRNKYVKRDEFGNYLSSNGFYQFSTMANCEAYTKAIDDLIDTPIPEEKLFKMKLSILENIKGIKGPMMSACWELIIHDKKIENK